MGQIVCQGEHDFALTNLGVGMARRACRRCLTVVIDLDAAEDAPLSAPGLFGPAKATIFSVLAEERRNAESVADNPAAAGRRGARFARGGSVLHL